MRLQSYQNKYSSEWRLDYDSVKQFWEYEERINVDKQETAISMSDIKCLKD